MWSWTFILTHQVFYCKGTPNWSYTINLALTKPWSFSVSVFRTLGKALSEEAITGLKGSSGITLQQDIRRDCSQSGLRVWLENGSQCRDDIITAAIGWTQSSQSSRAPRAMEPYRDERSKYKQHTKLPQSSCRVHLFKWLAGQCMTCHSWVTGRNEEWEVLREERKSSIWSWSLVTLFKIIVQISSDKPHNHQFVPKNSVWIQIVYIYTMDWALFLNVKLIWEWIKSA